MRGENEAVYLPVRTPTGSPPHAWGKSKMMMNFSDTLRLTPTCVGKINIILSCSHLSKAHPHMRGENASTKSFVQSAPGSPPHAWGKFCRCRSTPVNNGLTPHAWGKFIHVSSLHRYEGLTPTCVGKIVLYWYSSTVRWAHPHMRGEN